MRLGIPGEELALDGLAFLRSAKQGGVAGIISVQQKGTAIVVGGGNSAIDVARSLLRLGVSPTIVYRRRREDMPAFGHEVERALAEGVRIVELCAPQALTRVEGGIALRVQRMRPAGVGADGRMRVIPDGDATEVMTAGALYSAIGATHAAPWMLPPDDARLERMSHSAAFWDAPIGVPVLYAGDPVNEKESVADAIASGKQAAIALDVFFEKGASAVKAEIARCTLGDGTSLSMEIYLGGPRATRSGSVVSFKNINTDYFFPSEKKAGALMPPERAVASFEEVESSFGAAEAAAQAERCFNCGICNDCDNCRTYCPELAVTAFRAGRQDDWSTEPGPARDINADYCKGCGICVAECPRCAMIIKEQLL
jgi:NADPH-dependent glutamate synthase beta subunit-like oxidoreductase